jgi:hypothetical protein
MKFVELFYDEDDIDDELVKAPQPLIDSAQELLQQLLDYYDLSSPRNARLKILEMSVLFAMVYTFSRCCEIVFGHD